MLTYLASRYRHSSRDEWAKRIASGLVLLDGEPVEAGSLLYRSGELVWRRPPWIEPEAPTSLELLYEDDDLLAVAKPAGLPTMPGANFLTSTLLYLVRALSPHAAPLHRLGRWTSGVVLCAKNHHARATLSGQWETGDVGKRYRALATGAPADDEFTIDTPIGPVPHRLLGTVHAASPAGRPSLSQVTVIERRDGAFLCDVRIATGRPHQIRIHLASAGHPLVSDPLYGPDGQPLTDTNALPGDPGYHLHAAELTFPHPRTGRIMTILCEPPPLLRPSCTLR